jgi:hypothetical protein
MNNSNNAMKNIGMPTPNSNNNRKNNKSFLNSITETVSEVSEKVGLSGGKRNGKGTRKGSRKDSRKGTRKAQKGGKRALSGYMKFAAEQRKNMPKTSNVVSQAREIGKRWRALSEAEKSRYKK